MAGYFHTAHRTRHDAVGANLTDVTPPDRPTRLDLQQRSALAGEAAAAVAEVETALNYPSDPTAAAFFDVDNTVMQGASIFHLARGLHRRNFFTTRDILSAAWKQAYFRFVGVEDPEHVAEARASALGVHRGPHGHRARGAERGDLRRGDGAPDLARHPGPGPAAPRPGPAGLAGHRGARRDRPDHRPPARPDRRAGHRRRAPRTASTPASWSATCCTARPRPRRSRRWPPGRAWTWPPARRTPTPTTTCRCCRWSATRARSTPTAKLRDHAREQGWRIRDYRTGRKAARVGLVVAAVGRSGRRGGRRRGLAARPAALTPTRARTTSTTGNSLL